MIQTEYLIVGGGFAGANVAQQLTNAGFDTLLVDRKDYFEVTYSTLRDAAAPDSMAYSPRKRYVDFLQGGFRQASITALSDKKADLDNGDSIAFTHAIIATGSRYSSLPMVKSTDALSVEDRQEELAAIHQDIQKANHILIIGGGVVGVELAGEIAHAHPDKKVTLAHNQSALVGTFKPKAQQLARAQLEALGVTIETNRLYSADGDVYRDANSDNTIQADLVYSAIGTQPNSEFLREHLSSALDKKGFINVDSNLKIMGFNNLYALGDVANSGSHKLGYIAGMQADFLAKNIIAEKSGKKPKAYKPMEKLTALVPTGPDTGFVQTPFGVTKAKFIVNVKQKDLFISKTYDGLKASPEQVSLLSAQSI
jgi:NADH dehydrogenase FAD-containing subunit